MNNIIMVYPQSKVGWDAFGDIDENYAIHEGDYS